MKTDEGSERPVLDHFVDVNKMVDLGIHPESLSAAEDVKKIERRIAAEGKSALKNPDTLDS